jgi:hypothetical protein
MNRNSNIFQSSNEMLFLQSRKRDAAIARNKDAIA